MARLLKTSFHVAIVLLSVTSGLLAASSSPDLTKVKKDAEAKGYIFEASRDEIVAKAKKEGRLRGLSTMEIRVLKALRDAFSKKYPFIDTRAQELGPVAEHERFLLDLEAGATTGWDAKRTS